MCKILNACAIVFLLCGLGGVLGGCDLANNEAQVAATVAAVKNGAKPTATATQTAISITCASVPSLNNELQAITPLVAPGGRAAKVISTANASLGFIASVCGQGGATTGSLVTNLLDLWDTYQFAKAAVAQAKAATAR